MTTHQPRARLLAIIASVTLTITACEKIDLGRIGNLFKSQPAPSAPQNAPQDASPGSAPIAVTKVPPSVPGALVQLPDFSVLVEKEGPAVVNVSVTQKGRAGPNLPGIDPDDPFYDFFRRFIPIPRGGGEGPTRRGVGSGFIVSPDGYILTNAHVVEDADQVTVRLTDRREFKAKVVGADKRSDVALLKIEATEMPVVPIGDASKIKPGEWVVAIGSPFGFENTVTAGIVSAVKRSLQDETLVPFIQTDVAINPGNSGGPLFNLKGEVIGINSQIYSRTGGFMGLSFAIPIDVAMDVANQLKTTGKVAHGRLGVGIQMVDHALMESLGLPDLKGALVGSVEKGSAADKAGIQPGDVIREFNGQTVHGADELPRIVGLTKPGTSVKLKVWRKGQTKELSAVIGDAPAERSTSRNEEGSSATYDKLGLVLSDSDDGVQVEEVKGRAARAGVQPGDLIVAVNNRQIATVRDFGKALSERRGESLALLVRRGESTLFIGIPGGAG